METDSSISSLLKRIFIGKSRSVHDKKIFHKLSLIAFFAWIGLGADGISSSCYGPQEAFLALGTHHALSLVVAAISALTIIIISLSYIQIIDRFPSGGGGYIVASKLLSPTVGMISGAALLIDYVLTIAVSISAGADALFSFLPSSWYSYKLPAALIGVIIFVILNLRGVRESVMPLIPVFLTFILTHLFALGYAFVTHFFEMSHITGEFSNDFHATSAQLGFLGMVFLILRAYSMGAGTYTGIEAVSNALPILREPKVQTAKKTMIYMMLSLVVMAGGLMVAYLLYRVEYQHGKTLNAVLFEQISLSWGTLGRLFVFLSLFSEAMLLLIAAQTGFLGGPRVLANMALDRWVPTHFATLSDRLVTRNGILIMGSAAFLIMLFTRGQVGILVILYSINVFITFTLSQLGMVLEALKNNKQVENRSIRLCINGIGLFVTTFILIAVVVIKFHEGGWITLLVTGALVVFFSLVKQHYRKVQKMLKRLDALVKVTELSIPQNGQAKALRGKLKLDPKGKTAVIFVNGFNGLGLHTLFSILKQFPDFFKNFVFVQVGVVDAGNFKGTKEIRLLEKQLQEDGGKYVQYMKKLGYYAEAIYSIGIDAVDEIVKLAHQIQNRFPHPMFFGGQLVFEKDSPLYRGLHNYTIFSVHRRLHFDGIPVIIMPIRVY